jgi:hypothetical protein
MATIVVIYFQFTITVLLLITIDITIRFFLNIKLIFLLLAPVLVDFQQEAAGVAVGFCVEAIPYSVMPTVCNN